MISKKDKFNKVSFVIQKTGNLNLLLLLLWLISRTQTQQLLDRFLRKHLFV
jgi:type IV secretory pathway TrbL component